MINVEINRIPSRNSALRLSCENPELLTDRQLVWKYGKLRTIESARFRGLLPDDYFSDATSASTTGYVPRDLWLMSNIDFRIGEFTKEIEKRNMFDKFDVMVDLSAYYK